MINNDLTPTKKFIKFITKKNGEHPDLRIEIKTFDTPVMTTANHSIHTIVDILEEDGSKFGTLLYEAIFTQSEANAQFKDIMDDPMKYKN